MKPDRLAGAGWLLLGSPLALLIVLAIIGLFAGTPISILVSQLKSEDTQTAIGLSLKTTLIATGLVIVFGTFLALAIARSRPTVAAMLELIVTVPAIMPPSVAGIALLLAFGRQGLISTPFAFTSVAVVMAQAFVATPFFVREAAQAFRSISPEVLEAARLDGATGPRLASRIVLPLASPFLVTGAILAWTRALGEFGATILFAGNLKGETQTMPLAIYLGFESNLDEAKALAIVLLLFAVIILIAMRILLRRRMTFAH